MKRKLQQSENELNKSRTGDPLMLIATEYEPRPNSSYYMYKERDRYAKNQDIKD